MGENEGQDKGKAHEASLILLVRSNKEVVSRNIRLQHMKLLFLHVKSHWIRQFCTFQAAESKNTLEVEISGNYLNEMVRKSK